VKIEGKKVAYVVAPGIGKDGRLFGVGLCREGENGYHEVATYVPKMDESHIQGIVDRLNSRIMVNKEEAMKIVLSTMGRSSRDNRKRRTG